MPTIKYKPTTPARRQMSVPTFEELTKFTPEKSLIATKKKHSGRNSYGRITVRHRGGGNKRKYRIIDFRRDKLDMPATVQRIEYDPNRTCRIALLHYADGEKRYIPCPVGLKQGDQVMNGAKAEYRPGNNMMLQDIPDGINIHCIEMVPGKGAQLVRAAGQYAVLRAKENGYAQVRLPSGEVRMINAKCRATIGQVGNVEHGDISLGKAGKKRYLGFRPHVRGVVQNPADSPM